MELAIDQALHRAAEARETGDLQEAERLYREILKIQPQHPDASHFLGVLAVAAGQPETALVFLKTALDGDSQQGQYWVIYIYALIQCEQFENAWRTLEQGKEIGLAGDAIVELEQQLSELAPNPNAFTSQADRQPPKPSAAVQHSKTRSRAPSQQEMNEMFTHYSAGNLAEAERLAREVVKKWPDHPWGWKALEIIYRQTGRIHEALEPLEHAVRISPSDAEAHNNLGNVLRELGRLLEAESSFRSAVSLRPDLVEAHINLGVTLNALGRTKEAEASYREAIRLQPNNADAQNNLGKVLKNLGSFVEAEACYREAIRLNPALVEAHVNLGVVLNSVGRQAEAETFYREAIRLNPGLAEAHSNLGVMLNDLGRLTEAESCYREAIRLKPAYAEAHRNLSLLITYKHDDDLIPLIEQCYQHTAPTSKDRSLVCFALAKAYEDTGRFEEAFELYSEGNRLGKARIAYDIRQDVDLFDSIKSSFSMPSQPPAGGTMLRLPIFVLGMPRSGTSLVEQILASHSDVYGAGELSDLDFAVMTHAVSTAAGKRKFINTPDVIGRIREVYLQKLEALPTHKKFIVDKMPQNFLWIGYILSAFPAAKIINLVRDPVAICWSNFKIIFPNDGMGFTYDLDDLAAYYKLYLELMDFWRAQFPGKIYDLNYEALTENQEQETRKLLEFCGLEWQGGCLDFHLNMRAVSTASNVQVRKKMYKGSSQAWRKFERQLQPLIRGLGESVLKGK